MLLAEDNRWLINGDYMANPIGSTLVSTGSEQGNFYRQIYSPSQIDCKAAIAARPAVSVRNTRSPIDRHSAPWVIAACSSSGVKPPSGPIIKVTACAGWCLAHPDNVGFHEGRAASGDAGLAELSSSEKGAAR